MKRELVEILVEDLDADALSRMPEWFKLLREAYQEKIESKL